MMMQPSDGKVFNCPRRNELLDQVLDGFIRAFERQDHERKLAREQAFYRPKPPKIPIAERRKISKPRPPVRNLRILPKRIVVTRPFDPDFVAMFTRSAGL